MNKEKRKYIAPFIMLVAGLITSIINIVNQIELTEALVRLLVVLILFYIVGLISKLIISRIIDTMGNVELEESGETLENIEEKETEIKQK